MLIERYEPFFEETLELFEGQFSVEKPRPEANYDVKRGFGRLSGSKTLVKGWIKTKKNKTKRAKGGRSKDSYRKAARKASRTKKSDVSGQKKALKKRKKTMQRKKTGL